MIRLDRTDLVCARTEALERLATSLGVCPRATQTTVVERRRALIDAILRAESRIDAEEARRKLGT